VDFNRALQEVGSSKITRAIWNTALAAYPDFESVIWYRRLEDVPGLEDADDADRSAALEDLARESVARALQIANFIDEKSSRHALYLKASRLASSLSFFSAGAEARERAAQEKDATAKLIGLVACAALLDAGALHGTEAGREAIKVCAALDIALPGLLTGTEGVPAADIIARRRDDACALLRRCPALDEQTLEIALGKLPEIIPWFETNAQAALPETGRMADQIRGFLPVSQPDTAQGLLASGVDLLPFYLLLVTRMAAEGAVHRSATPSAAETGPPVETPVSEEPPAGEPPAGEPLVEAPPVEVPASRSVAAEPSDDASVASDAALDTLISTVETAGFAILTRAQTAAVLGRRRLHTATLRRLIGAHEIKLSQGHQRGRGAPVLFLSPSRQVDGGGGRVQPLPEALTPILQELRTVGWAVRPTREVLEAFDRKRFTKRVRRSLTDAGGAALGGDVSLWRTHDQVILIDDSTMMVYLTGGLAQPSMTL